MFGLCCFAQSGAAKEPPKTKPPNLLEEAAENLEAFKEGLRSISTPATSFQKIAPDMVGMGKSPITSIHPPQSQASRKGKKVKNGGDTIPARDMEVFERRQFEAYKEEVEKRRRLQLIERQMALFNTWEFYNEQEMWDLLVRYNQYIQSGHQIFLTPMPDCPIHGHSITSKHQHQQQQQQQQQQHPQHQQQSKRSHKPHKKLKQRRRQSATSLSDDQSSPYASQYSDNQRSDRSRSSLTSQVSAEIHSVEKTSIQSVLKIMTSADPPLPSDASEKDSGIDKNSLNSSIGNGSDRSSRKSLEHAPQQQMQQELQQQQQELQQQQQQLQEHTASPTLSQKSARHSPSPLPPLAAENDYDLDVPPKGDEDDTHETADYRDYREGIYYARDEVKPDSAFGAIWENCSSSPTINTYEDMDLERRGSLSTNARRPRQRDESDEFAPLSEPHTESVYGNQEVEEEPVSATPKGADIESNESALNSIEKYYNEDQSQGAVTDCRDLLECKGDQCSPSKVMLRSLNLSNHNLTDIPKSNESSLERKHAYSKVNKEGMKIYDLTVDVRDSSTPPPPLPEKRIEALIHEEQDFYDDSRGQPESESLVRSMEPDDKSFPGNLLQQQLPDVHKPTQRAITPSPPRTPRNQSPPRTVEQEPQSDEPVVVDEQPRRGQQPTAPSTAPAVTEQAAVISDDSDTQTDESSKVMFDMPKLRDASERKITPISEESDELSIRTEIQKVITKLHKTGGWRKATCTPGEPYLTLDLRKETKTDLELPLDFETRAKEPLVSVTEPLTTNEANAVAEEEPVKEPEQTLAAASSDETRAYSQIDMEALDFKKAREALKKFTNDGSNPLLKQVPNRSIPLLIEVSLTRLPGDASTVPAKTRLTKTVSAPPNLKATQILPPSAIVSTSDHPAAKIHQEPAEPIREPAAHPEVHQDSVRDEEDDRINFKAARETLQKLTSLNNGMFFMTDRKNRQVF